MKKIIYTFVLFFISALMIPGLAQEDDPVGLTPSDADAENVKTGKHYSPYAGRNFPTQVYWGETHLHTDNSLDARGFGAMVNVDEAFRFAKGEEITSSTGLRFKMGRPLDWLVVADHSDGMGVMKELIKGNPELLKDKQLRQWHNMFLACFKIFLPNRAGKTLVQSRFGNGSL
jgi:hypothetical protein